MKALALGLMLLVAVAAGMVAPLAGAAAQQKRWAGLDPNSEASSPVAWGGSEEEARTRAIEACRRVSKTCANGPALTDDMREVFAVVCCAKPKPGCVAAAAPGRREAMRSAQRALSDTGYSDCSVRHYMSAGTGKRQ